MDTMDAELVAAALPIPTSFKCPITHEVMEDPVRTVDGRVYERPAIEEWFRRGHETSPLTNARLPSLQLTTDHAFRGAIDEYLARRPEIARRTVNRAARTFEVTPLERHSGN